MDNRGGKWDMCMFVDGMRVIQVCDVRVPLGSGTVVCTILGIMYPLQWGKVESICSIRARMFSC